MESEEKRVKKNWSKEQTMALLKFYRARQAEFQHSRRKKFAYAHVLDDMISAGSIENDTTALHLEVKMAALLRAYKAAKDKPRYKHAAPCVAPFMRQMDEIFGLNPSVKKISCGAVDFEVVKDEPPINSIEISDYITSRLNLEEEILPTINNPPSSLNNRLNTVVPQPDINSTPAPSISGCNMPSDVYSSKPKTPANYFENRFQQHERSERDKSKRWEQYLRIQEEKAERHRERMNKLDSIIGLLMKREF